MRTVLSLAAMALFAACATDPAAPADQQQVAAGREEKIICGMEEPTGSRLKVKRCWTQDQIDREGDDSRKALERGQSQRPMPKAPGGGR